MFHEETLSRACRSRPILPPFVTGHRLILVLFPRRAAYQSRSSPLFNLKTDHGNGMLNFNNTAASVWARMRLTRL